MQKYPVAALGACVLAVLLALSGINTVSADHGGTHPPSTTCPWDVNADGIVNVDDALAVIQSFGLPSTQVDVNSDGIVDQQDVLAVLDNQGPCGATDDGRPPFQPNAEWVREILDGNATEAAHDAVQRALG